jgi:hypothetical protein
MVHRCLAKTFLPTTTTVRAQLVHHAMKTGVKSPCAPQRHAKTLTVSAGILMQNA